VLRKLVFVTGAVIGLLGIGLIAFVPYFYYRSQLVGKSLISQTTQSFVKNHGNSTKVKSALGVAGSLGIISIPDISLQAPVLEGTDDKEINVAVGHLTTSVQPGQIGTSVLAAHNATWFHNVDHLSIGNQVVVQTDVGTYTFRVTQMKVVRVGADVYNTSTPSLVLETCYPLNALYLTPYRYLVFASIDTSVFANSKPLRVKESMPYRAAVPSTIPWAKTQLTAYPLPLGSLTYEGQPSADFIQSNTPLDVSNALVSLYLAWIYASSTRNYQALHQMGVKVSDDPFIGIPEEKIRSDVPFDVVLKVSGNQLISARATEVVTVVHTFHISLTASVSGHSLSISSLSIKSRR